MIHGGTHPQALQTTSGINRRGIRPAWVILALVAPLLAYSASATRPATSGAACGIAPWTGTCSCIVSGGMVPFARYVALRRATGGAAAESALRAESQSCRLPGAAAAAAQSAPTPLPPG